MLFCIYPCQPPKDNIIHQELRPNPPPLKPQAERIWLPMGFQVLSSLSWQIAECQRAFWTLVPYQYGQPASTDESQLLGRLPAAKSVPTSSSNATHKPCWKPDLTANPWLASPPPYIYSKYLRLTWPGFCNQQTYLNNKNFLFTVGIPNSLFHYHLVNGPPWHERTIIWTPKWAKIPQETMDLLSSALIQSYPNSAHPCLPDVEASQPCIRAHHVARKLLLLRLFFIDSSSVWSQSMSWGFMAWRDKLSGNRHWWALKSNRCGWKEL